MGDTKVTYTGKQYISNVKPQHQPKPKRPKRNIRWGRLFLFLLLLTFAFSAIGLAGYGFYLERKITAEPINPDAVFDPQKPVNILLIGLDRDPGARDEARRTALNTDTLILATVHPETGKTTLITLPRDARVELPTGMGKLNAAYATGGLDRLNQTVTELIGQPVDRYLMIDFPSFARAIDTMGGITFDVDKPLYDPEGRVKLQPGRQTLNGQQALTVVRFRQEERGDYARAERQQRFLSALLTKSRQTGVLDWMQSLRAMSDTLRTDMTISELGTVATALQRDGAAVTADIAPGQYLELNGVTYWKLDTGALRSLVEQAQQ